MWRFVVRLPTYSVTYSGLSVCTLGRDRRLRPRASMTSPGTGHAGAGPRRPVARLPGCRRSGRATGPCVAADVLAVDLVKRAAAQALGVRRSLSRSLGAEFSSMASVTGAKSEEAGRHSTPGRTPRGKARAPWWCKPLESPAGQDGGSIRQRFFNSVFHSFWGWRFPGPQSCCPAHFAIGSRKTPLSCGDDRIHTRRRVGRLARARGPALAAGRTDRYGYVRVNDSNGLYEVHVDGGRWRGRPPILITRDEVELVP